MPCQVLLQAIALELRSVQYQNRSVLVLLRMKILIPLDKTNNHKHNLNYMKSNAHRHVMN